MRLKQAVNLIAWDAPRLPSGMRPQIRCRTGTRVRHKKQVLPSGAIVHTVYVRRHGQWYSNTRTVLPNGRTIKGNHILNHPR